MNFFLILLQAGTALITSPAPGQTVSGVVNITGTALRPQFARYEVAFAYDPNPTDTWFEIQPPSPTPVSDGPLAAWDTRSITDGTYMIRLRVYASDASDPLETVVRGIAIRGSAAQPPLETPAPAPPPTTAAPPFASATAALFPSPTPRPLLPETAPDLSPFTSAFCSGVYFTFGVFAMLGAYAILRDRIRRPIRRWLRRIMSDIRKP